MNMTDFARAALPATLDNARKHPFYKQSWAAFPAFPQDPEEPTWIDAFTRLPALDRTQLAADMTPLLEEGDAICSITHSSGSTGSPVYRFRSVRESELVRKLGAVHGRSNSSSSRLRCLGISLYAPYHAQRDDGAVRQTGDYEFSATVWEDHFLRSAIATLTRTYSIPGFQPRVSYITGSARFVGILTQAMQDQGVRHGDLGIKAIGIFGGYLSSQVRKDLETYWNLPITHRYSLSEAAGGATVCPRCGFLLFDAHLLSSHEPQHLVSSAGRSVGDLLMTELYPYSLVQPLVKYRTGDIVEVIGADTACCEAHVGGYRHLGRRSMSLLIEQGQGRDHVLLGSTELREALYCDVVAKTLELPQLSVLRDRSRLGVPIASARMDERQRLIVSFRPTAGIDVDLARNEVEERLRKVSAHLRAALDQRITVLEVIANEGEQGQLYK